MPGAPRQRKGPLIAPQHRMVFGLVMMSTAALLLTLSFRGKGPAAGPAVPGPPPVPVSRVALPSPTPGQVRVGAVATDAVLDATVQAMVAEIDRCTGALAAAFGDQGGELRVELVLDSGGLRTAELVGAHLPQPPALACLAGAVHGQAWPTVIGDPLQLRVPFFVVLPLDGSTAEDGARPGGDAPPENDAGRPPEEPAGAAD